MSMYTGYKPKKPKSTGARPAPIRPGNFFGPQYLNSVSQWTERTPPERIQFDVLGQLPKALQFPGSALEAPAKYSWEVAKFLIPGAALLENEQGQGPIQQLMNWIGEVTPIGGVAQVADDVLTNLSKAQSAIGNAQDARLLEKVVDMPDGTILTRKLLLELGMSPQVNTHNNKTVGEFKQELANRGFNIRYDKSNPDVPILMPWSEVAQIVRSDELMGPYQFGEATISESLPTHMAYQIVTDPLNLLFGAGTALKLIRASRLGAAASRVEEAQQALKAAQAAKKGIAAAKADLAAAQANQARLSVRTSLPTVGWSESPALKGAALAGNQLRQAWGVGYLEDMVRNGLRVARVPNPQASAAAMAANGTAESASLKGFAELLRKPEEFLLGEKPRSPFFRYYQAGLGTQIGGVAAEMGAGALEARFGSGPDSIYDNEVLSGFFGGIHDAFYEINNNHILSEDALYTLTTIWLLPTIPALKDMPSHAIPRPLEGGIRTVEWVKRLEPTFRDSEGVGVASGKAAERNFLARFEGGADGFAMLRRLIISRIAFKRYIQQNPKLKARFESFEGLTRAKLMAEMVQPMVDTIIKEGKIREKDLVDEFIDWATTHGRTMFDDEGGFRTDVPREVAYGLTPDAMIAQWNKYVAAMRRLNEIIDGRLEATIVRADRMGRESIDDLIAALNTIQTDGKIDVRILQDWLVRTQAMFEDPGMNPAFWERYMNPGVAMGEAGDFFVEVKPILDELQKVRDNAPTHRELYHESVLDEANAADSPIQITDFGDNSPLTPEGVRLVQSQADVDVVSVEQNVAFAAAKRVRLRMEEDFRRHWTSRGLPRVEAQWRFNRTIRRHSDRIFQRLTRGYKPPVQPAGGSPKVVQDAASQMMDDIGFFIERKPASTVGERVHELNSGILRRELVPVAKPGIRHELTVQSAFGDQVLIVSRDAKGEIDGILAIMKDRVGDRDIYVKQDRRRQGVATRLYEAAEKMGYEVRTPGTRTAEGLGFTEAYYKRPPVAAVESRGAVLPPLRTIDAKTGEAISHGNKGYQVGVHPGEFSLIMPGDTEGLASTLQMMRRYYPGAEASSTVDDLGRLSLSPSVHIKTLDEAMDFARVANQEHIYDHSTKQRIEVEYPPERSRAVPDVDPVWEMPKEHLTDIEAREPNGYGPQHTEWWNQIRRGIALGRVSLDDLRGMGADDMQIELKLFEVGITKPEPLPSTLYHATTARSGILSEGLQSAVEIERAGKTPAGLGGTPNLISMADSLKVAEELAEDYRLLVDLLQGRTTMRDLFDEVFALDPDHAYTHSLLNELNAKEASIARWKELGGMQDHIDNALTSFFQTDYLWARDAVGGRRNPVFVGSNVELVRKYKNVSRDEIGVVTLHPRQGAQGYSRIDFGITEWRTWHGDAVVVEGGARNRFALADAEAVARRKWDELRESELAAIRARKQIEKDLKRQWKVLKQEADQLRILRIDKRWFDRFNEGRAEFSLDQLRHLRDMQDVIRKEFPDHFDVGPAPKLMAPWSSFDGPVQALYTERSMLKNILFDYGPLGRLTQMIDFLTEPVSASKMVIDARRMYANYLTPKGAKPREIRRYFALLLEETKKHRWGPSDAPLYRGTTALPESVLRDTAHLVFDKKTVEAVERAYGGRWAAPMNMAYNSLIRRIDARIMQGAKAGRLSRAVREGYMRFHTTKGLGAMAEGTRMIGKVVYPLVRFTIDVRWQAMNYLEADILALFFDGLRTTKGRGMQDLVVRHGRRDINVSKQAADFHGTRNQLARVPGKTGVMPIETAEAAGVFQTHKRMWPVFNRQFNLRREDNIIALIDSLPRTGPEYANLVKRLGDDPRTWSQQIEDMLYAYDQKGVAFSIRHEAERIRRGDGWTDEEWIQMQPFISRAIELNQKSFDDLVQMHVGNINRSRMERLLNSYWLYWPIGYQLKAGRWLLKVMNEKAFGATSNMLGSYQIDRWAQDFKDRLVTSSSFRREFEENEALWFAAAMFLPLTPIDVGVSLNRGVRYVGGNVFGLWPEYSNIDGPFDVMQRMLSLGPLYTAQLLDSLSKSGYVQGMLPDFEQQPTGPPVFR